MSDSLRTVRSEKGLVLPVGSPETESELGLRKLLPEIRCVIVLPDQPLSYDRLVDLTGVLAPDDRGGAFALHVMNGDDEPPLPVDSDLEPAQSVQLSSISPGTLIS